MSTRHCLLYSHERNLLAVIARAASPSLPPHGWRSGRLFMSSLRLIRKGLSAFNSGILFHHNSALVVLHSISSNSSQSPSHLVNCAVMLEAMAEALAAEVADFGIKVTIIEPGAFHTEFQSSIKNSRTIVEYDAVREKLHAMFTPDMFGEPAATSEALFKVVDADEPPLRLVLGSSSLPIIRKIYADRLDTWEKWEAVSNAAQGSRKA